MHPDKRPKPHQPPQDQPCYNALDRDKLVIAKAIGALSLINTASHTLLSVLIVYLELSEQERAEIMSTVVEAFAVIDNAVDQVTTDAADEIQRAASQIQILINTNKASDVDASPIINKLLSLSNTLRNTNFQTMVNNDPNLSDATKIPQTPAGAQTPSSDAGTASNIPVFPENGNSEGNSSQSSSASTENSGQTNTQSSTVIGVSDSDNPMRSASSSPLGSQRPIDSRLKPPTDDLTPAAPSASPSDNSTDAANAENSEDSNSDSTTASGNIENG